MNRTSASPGGGEQLGLEGMPRRLYPCTPDPAEHLAGLPAPVPDDLPGPPAAAEGPAVGAQQPRRQRAQRAGRRGGGCRSASAPWPPRATCSSAAGSTRATPTTRSRPRHRGRARRHGGGLRRRARPGRRAGGRGADGGDPHRADRGVRPDRPAGRAAGPATAAPSWWSWTTRPAGTCSPWTTPAPRCRWRCTRWPPSGCCAGPAAGWSCTTCRPAGCWPGSTPSESLARQLRPGRGHRRRVRGRRRAVPRRAGAGRGERGFPPRAGSWCAWCDYRSTARRAWPPPSLTSPGTGSNPPEQGLPASVLRRVPELGQRAGRGLRGFDRGGVRGPGDAHALRPSRSAIWS